MRKCKINRNERAKNKYQNQLNNTKRRKTIENDIWDRLNKKNNKFSQKHFFIILNCHSISTFFKINFPFNLQTLS